MDAEIGAIERALSVQFLDHLAHERLERLRGDPAGAGAGAWPKRRFDADELHRVELARHLHEAAHVAARVAGDERLTSGR